ncbi:amino acid transporter, putative [Perkinsus marinus ATCC 50983]|uniref:Amino acid transporter, putative n=1 Tax=Perkinsus marinus (strain ATCC 50983 / TXsc) TaxID=423536 RepID=C5L8C8_PERM5|nr:amino acid transporter, putative [Perkinsus marinus ATCC 50983]EER07015.1 amino acid transporter, putative [Perkinsus marinus ATCC 50983]|eukprot:XP_002775199.1 amino acid transporter, putative [Perkinsus marinus ATCC 50983]
MRSVSFWAVLICFVVYYGVGFAGVYTWGFDTKDNILYNYNLLFKDSIDVTIAFIAMAISIATAYPLCIFPARFGLESALLVLYPSRFDSDDSGRASPAVVTLLTAITVLLSLGCAVLAPSIAQVFELVGSTSGNQMTLKTFEAWSVMLIGVVFVFIGTAVAIKDMSE